MIEVKKIKEKVELKDMEVNDYDPCYHYWKENKRNGQQDCNSDCTGCGKNSAGHPIEICSFGTSAY